MKILTTNLDSSLNPANSLFIYNAYDCCITHEILPKIISQFTPEDSQIYEFELAQYAAVLLMNRNGIAVDMELREKLLNEINLTKKRLTHILECYCEAMGLPLFNPDSPSQLIDIFYTRLGFKPIINYKTKRPTTDRDALEQLAEIYPISKPLIKVILSLREQNKKQSVLTTALDSDNKIRASFRVAGTETGRYASRENIFGTGTNLQNINDALREIFIPSRPDYKFAYIDLEQAESRAVAGIVYALTGDLSYWNACHSADLHTVVCRLIWPDRAWTGDIEADKALAEEIFYRSYSFRDIGKRAGHGSNYYGKPPAMAKHLKVHKEIVETFQNAYFSAFPGIPLWHQQTKLKLQTTGQIRTAFGRRRCFFGRLTDDSTLREAIAFEPQSTVADCLNTALARMPVLDSINLLAQIHDAILFEYPAKDETKILNQALKLMSVEIPYKDKILIIPSEVKVGWNWASRDPSNPSRNPFGMQKWKGCDDRQPPKRAEFNLLDQRLY